jgi:hypothetical protein
MRTVQRGLGTFGTLIVIALAGAGGWWVYKNVFETDTVSAPTCETQQANCMTNCRKTSTEAAQIQACQDGCRRNFASCKGEKR